MDVTFSLGCEYPKKINRLRAISGKADTSGSFIDLPFKLSSNFGKTAEKECLDAKSFLKWKISS
jgi:hypothetical protein